MRMDRCYKGQNRRLNRSSGHAVTVYVFSLSHGFGRNHLNLNFLKIETALASPERVESLIACALRGAWMVVPPLLNSPYQMELNYPKNMQVRR